MFFPPELYRPVVQNVHSRADLHRLLFVSHIVSNEAERALYHTIHVTTTAQLAISMQLLPRLARSPRVARYVREVELSGGFSASALTTGNSGIHHPDQYWSIISEALAAMQCLRALILSIYFIKYESPAYSFPPSNIFSNCAFKLEVFKFTDWMDGELAIEMTQLKELYLGRGLLICRTIQFPPDALPALTILSSSPNQFLQLGCHNTRQIKALELIETSRLVTESIFPSVTSLRFYSGYYDTIKSFPSLRFLCMNVGAAHLEVHSVLSALVRTLSVLTSLEALCFITYESPFQCPAGLHSMFFSALCNLERLVIVPWSQDGECWGRNASEPTPIPVARIKNEWKNPHWV